MGNTCLSDYLLNSCITGGDSMAQSAAARTPFCPLRTEWAFHPALDPIDLWPSWLTTCMRTNYPVFFSIVIVLQVISWCNTCIVAIRLITVRLVSIRIMDCRGIGVAVCIKRQESLYVCLGVFSAYEDGSDGMRAWNPC